MDDASSDFLAQKGMSQAEQHGAVMRAAAVPASQLEGDYPLYKATTSGANLLSKVLFESRMRREMNNG
jgi:hypothetical protein